jgi:hypothetical protein
VHIIRHRGRRMETHGVERGDGAFGKQWGSERELQMRMDCAAEEAEEEAELLGVSSSSDSDSDGEEPLIKEALSEILEFVDVSWPFSREECPVPLCSSPSIFSAALSLPPPFRFLETHHSVLLIETQEFYAMCSTLLVSRLSGAQPCCAAISVILRSSLPCRDIPSILQRSLGKREPWSCGRTRRKR